MTKKQPLVKKTCFLFRETTICERGIDKPFFLL